MRFAVKDEDGNFIINGQGERILFSFKSEAKIHRDTLQQEAFPEIEVGPNGRNLKFFVTKVQDAANSASH